MPIAVNPDTGAVVHLAEDGQWKPAQTAVNPQTKEMVAFDGRDWKPVPAQSKGVLGYVDDAVRAIANGVTFGWADELAAKGNELVGRGTYDENLKAEAARSARIPAGIKIPGEIAGAVGGAVVTMPIAGAAAAATGLSRLPQAARFIGGGAASGAAFGAGEAEPGSRLEGAGHGALIGAGAGAIIPPVVRGLGSAARGVRNAFSTDANVASDLARAIGRDADTPAAVTQRAIGMQTEKPMATLADAGGENVRGLVERVAQTPGAGRTVVVPALTNRQQFQLGRIANDLRELTGTHRTARQAIDETMAERAAAARPLYDEAFNFNARAVPEIDRAWQQVSSTGWGQHITNSPDFRRTLQTEYGIANPADAPLMVVIDAFKKQADGLVGEAVRAGNNNKARVIGEMRDRLVETLDQHNPAYATARAAWAGPSRYLQAIEEGRNLFNVRVSADELTTGLSRMAESDREGYRIGAVSAIIGKMGNDPAKLADMTKYLRSPEMRAKIAAIMPTQEAAQRWTQRLNFEVSSSELTGRALGNSATYRRQMERQDADGIVGDLVMDALSGTPAAGLLRRMLTAAPRAVRDTLRSRSDNALAEVLTDPTALQRLRPVLDRAQTAGRPVPQGVQGAAVNAWNALINGGR